MTTKVINGRRYQLTESDIEEIRVKEERHDLKVEALKRTEYQRKREAEYGDWRLQLDMIYHGGMDTWIAHIATIKAKYPKPKS